MRFSQYDPQTPGLYSQLLSQDYPEGVATLQENKNPMQMQRKSFVGMGLAVDSKRNQFFIKQQIRPLTIHIGYAFTEMHRIESTQP